LSVIRIHNNCYFFLKVIILIRFVPPHENNFLISSCTFLLHNCSALWESACDFHIPMVCGYLPVHRWDPGI